VGLADPPGVRDVRGRTIAACTWSTTRTGEVVVLGVIDNLWKGTSSQACSRSTSFRAAQTGPPGVTVPLALGPAPDWVRELPGGLPAGFRAAGVAAGLKAAASAAIGPAGQRRRADDGAARFTRSGVLAAPVLVTRERAAGRPARVSSPTRATRTRPPASGLDAAAKMQGAGRDGRRRRGSRRRRLDRRHRRPLDGQAVASSLARARAELRPTASGDSRRRS
jgi:hypothetical protein